MARVLHIHVSNLSSPGGVNTMDVQVSVIVGLSSGDPIVENPTVTITLKTLGIYKTAIQMNLAIADWVKNYLYDIHAIPTNGYDATYVSGAYGLLNIL